MKRPKTIEELRRQDSEDMTMHDIVTMQIIVGICAGAYITIMSDEQIVRCSRNLADEFLKQREPSYEQPSHATTENA